MTDAPQPKDLVAAGRFNTVEEAHMAAARLAAEGVEAEVEPHGGYDQLQLVASPRGIAVLVPREQLAAAQAVLTAVGEEPQDESPEGGPAGEPTE